MTSTPWWCRGPARVLVTSGTRRGPRIVWAGSVLAAMVLHQYGLMTLSQARLRADTDLPAPGWGASVVLTAYVVLGSAAWVAWLWERQVTSVIAAGTCCLLVLTVGNEDVLAAGLAELVSFPALLVAAVRMAALSNSPEEPPGAS